ncbi:MarR family transcriptional regulator [Paenibacillus sp. YPG26]|uniref:MarR family winged helix-turn-helix transcriptional regulator n=1 Tax=Paenibacillus sp. YPG26 TaxID=2878915 RepID=UPI00203ADE67|nr:MarR family transcriptional regulator [Paenibacillus sp. YPG26]USB32672.1 MarR family transcriptional regulator [Paenibacillus sp. YPG26]
MTTIWMGRGLLNSPLDESIGFHMGIAYRKMSQVLQQRLRDYHITPEQWSVLYRISEKEGQIQREIGERSGKDKPTTTRIITALEEKGFIRRVSGENDRRSFFIFITEEGRSVIRDTIPLERQILKEVTEGMTDEESKLLLKLLRQIAGKADLMIEREKKE